MDISKITVTSHHRAVRQLPCVVTGRPDITLHHCHGGSLKDRGWSLNKPRNQALVIPIIIDLHSIGPNAIDGDMGVVAWEAMFGTQAEFLDGISDDLGYDVWELAELWRKSRP